MNNFKCQKCGNCCKWGGYVYITQEDVERISKYLSLNESEFVNRFAEIANRPRLNLKTNDNNECIFLKDNLCSIHPVKPKQCRDFPIVWKIKEIEELCNGQKRRL